MTPTEIKGNRYAATNELKQKSASLGKKDQLKIKSKNQTGLGRELTISSITKEENYKRQTPDSTKWVSDWGVDGGERKRIEVCQSEAKNKKYGQFNKPIFLF